MKKNEVSFTDYVMKESTTVCGLGVTSVVVALIAIATVLIII